MGVSASSFALLCHTDVVNNNIFVMRFEVKFFVFDGDGPSQ